MRCRDTGVGVPLWVGKLYQTHEDVTRISNTAVQHGSHQPEGRFQFK